jgi:hypothetical protein
MTLPLHVAYSRYRQPRLSFERGHDLGGSRSWFRWQEVRGVLEPLVPDGRHRQDLSCVGRTGL